MSSEKNMDILYNLALVTTGAVGISLTSKKVLGEPLPTPTTIDGTLKMAVAAGLSSLLVNYLDINKYIPRSLNRL